MSSDHPFASFLRTVGRGPRLSRPLERDEARQAMGLILDGAVDPVQVGALLMLLRFRGETADEMAGFVQAARERIAAPAGLTPYPSGPDLDWPSYADRHRQQPWFVLTALLLAENGVRVLMHGIEGFAEGYAPTRPVLAALGIQPAANLAEARQAMERQNFAYVGLETFCPALERLFQLRPLLGVRTAVNSLSRALNPLLAPCQMQGVFHPPYRTAQQRVAVLLGQPRAAIFKGGGGEVLRNPLKPCRTAWVRDGEAGEENWPAILPEESYAWREEPLGPEVVAALWRGEVDLPVPEAAVVGTAAMALHALGRVATIEEAEAQARRLWAKRRATRSSAAE
jgi:anthranilate phosphoribosyltransferase